MKSCKNCVSCVFEWSSRSVMEHYIHTHLNSLQVILQQTIVITNTPIDEWLLLKQKCSESRDCNCGV